MRIWLEALEMWGVGRLQVHAIYHYNNVHSNNNINNNNNNNNTVYATHTQFLLPILIEVAFKATVLYPSLQDSIYLSKNY